MTGGTESTAHAQQHHMVESILNRAQCATRGAGHEGACIEPMTEQGLSGAIRLARVLGVPSRLFKRWLEDYRFFR